MIQGTCQAGGTVVPVLEQAAVLESEQEAVLEPEHEAVLEPEQEAVLEPEQEAVLEPEQELSQLVGQLAVVVIQQFAEPQVRPLRVAVLVELAGRIVTEQSCSGRHR